MRITASGNRPPVMPREPAVDGLPRPVATMPHPALASRTAAQAPAP